MAIRYINRKGDGYRETVDEFPYNTREERRETRRMLAEYRMSDPAAEFGISRRCCKDWNDPA